MTPGVVGDQRQGLVVRLELALLVEVERLHVGLQRNDGIGLSTLHF